MIVIIIGDDGADCFEKLFSFSVTSHLQSYFWL